MTLTWGAGLCHASEMPDATVVEWIRSKSVALVGELDERGWRRWAAAEAVSLGRGGIAAVAAATGISDRTIRNGIRELSGAVTLPVGQQRRAARADLQEKQSSRRWSAHWRVWSSPWPVAIR